MIHRPTRRNRMTARLGALLFFITSSIFISLNTAAGQETPPPSPVTLQEAAPIREAMIVAPALETQPPAPSSQVSPPAPPLEEPIQIELTNLKGDYPELSALPDENVWQRIRSSFAMNELKSPLIRRHEKWYASHPDYVLRMSERAQRYLFYIVEEVERRGMPSEIALLPIIESAFNPGANSVARASGIWQFIPSTGKSFGMQQNWWYDGRRDVIGATNGALDYLQKLHDQFGDWELALAAYNWGENAVARAQAKNRKRGKPTNYSSLKMPRETSNYVPKLLAVKNIVSDPARFGLVFHDIPNRPYFAVVTTSKPMDLEVAAKLAEISMDEFTALNPGHNRPVLLQDSNEVILLPVDKVDTFRNNLENHNERLVTWRALQTNKGESFGEIATRFGITEQQLRTANGLSKYAFASNGQTILVPIGEDEEESEFAPFNMHDSAVAEMSGFGYTVRKGDTISSLAKRFRTSQSNLIAMNRGSRHLRVGQRFSILASNGPVRRKAHAKRSTSKRVRMAASNR